jgi:SAM-dependent methyltransferase
MQTSPETVQAIADLIESELGQAVYPYDYHQVALDRIDPHRSADQFEVMQRYIPGDYLGLRLLEVGCSFGSYQEFALNAGMKTYGIEPELKAIQLGRQVWEQLQDTPGMVQAIGEHLPFMSNSFDIVFSSNVLEHVKDTDQVIAEAIRVLKPGGYLHFIFPNYGSVWDGHYALPWIPYMPYWAARLYVRLWGRSPHYVDTLQLLNIFDIRRFRKTHPNMRLVSLGHEMFQVRLTQVSFSEWSGMNNLGKIVHILRQLKLAPLTASLSTKLALFTPFIMTLQKQKG